MAINDFTQLADILEKDIMPSVKMQLYKKAPLWEIFGGFQADEAAGMIENRVNPPSIEFKNDKIYVTIENGRPNTDGIDPGEKFGYGLVSTDQGYVGFVTPVGAFIIPKSVLRMKDGGAIVNALNYKNKSTTNALAMSLNRQCYGDATATLGVVAASGSSTTVTLKPKNTASTLYNNDIPLAIRNFAVGMKIKVGANAICSVSSISGANSIVVDATQTLVAGTSVIKYNASDAVAAELDGLSLIVDDASTYLTIDVATSASWASYVDANSGAAKAYADGDWDLAYLQAAVLGDPRYIMCNMTEFKKYGASLVSQKRFSSKEMLSGGWKGLEYMGGNASIIMDPDCPDDKVFFLSPEEMFRAELYPLEFEPGTLGNGQRLVQQLDYEVVMDTACNIGTTVRSAHSLLENRVG